MPSVSDIVRSQQSTGEKLSSQQDFRVLDDLLDRALEPLEAETESYFEWLAEIVAFSLTSRRRLNEGAVVACVNGLCRQPRSARDVVGASIDRGHVFSVLRRTQQAGESLEKAQLECLRRRNRRVSVAVLKEIETARIRLGEGPLTVPAVRASRYWYNLALRHKKNIIDQFQRKLGKTASQISHASGRRVDEDAAYQDAYVAASVSVDRFRADSGVLAPYMTRYLQGSSRVSASHAKGLAAPGARVASADALQAGPIDAALELSDPSSAGSFLVRESEIVSRIDAVSSDPDVRAALMVSDVTPPAAAALARRSKHLHETTGV